MKLNLKASRSRSLPDTANLARIIPETEMVPAESQPDLRVKPDAPCPHDRQRFYTRSKSEKFEFANKSVK